MYNRSNKQRYSLRKPYVAPVKRQYLLLRLILVLAMGTGLFLFLVSPLDAETHSADLDLYYYQQGRQAAARLQSRQVLSASQIQQALRGFEAQLRNQASPYTQETLRAAYEAYQENRLLRQETAAQKNLMAGERYVAELDDSPGYAELDQGLLYKILKQGQGPVPGANARLRLKYVLYRLDGSEIDRNGGANWVSIQGVLPGWRIALRQMPVGSQWRIVLPPHLAYGEKGAGNKIGPLETLIVDLSLLDLRN